MASRRDALARMAPAESISTALVFVVPWSMAKISFSRATNTLLQQLHGGFPNALGSQSEVFEQKCGGTGGRKFAGNTEYPHANGMRFHYHFRHGAAESADHRVFLDSHN